MHMSKISVKFLTVFFLASSSSFVLAQNCNTNVSLTKPNSSYIFNTTGDEVTDKITGLIWKRCAEGMSWNGATCSGTAITLNWEGALAHAIAVSSSSGQTWRLPNIKELNSLVETVCNKPSINQMIFPSVEEYSWSSSLIMYNGSVQNDYVYVLSIGNGVNVSKMTSDYLSVRLVR